MNEIFAGTFDRAALSTMAESKGVHRDELVTLFRWAALRLAHICWRNSVLED
ncbi:hypothetical protein [Nocardioides aurantiacus]|uniref:hypothetical protein n=1 Tax=Nocardioides aurantiacus TaxID=86796 RepID=UPI00403F1948